VTRARTMPPGSSRLQTRAVPVTSCLPLGIWNEAAVVALGQGGRQVPNMECSHHDRDGLGIIWVPRPGHEKAHLGFERAARRRNRHTALAEQFADFLGGRTARRRPRSAHPGGRIVWRLTSRPELGEGRRSDPRIPPMGSEHTTRKVCAVSVSLRTGIARGVAAFSVAT
jgi:hypothetical protein